MSAVITVFVVWFAAVAVLAAAAIATAPRWRAPAWVRAARTRGSAAIGASNDAVGRLSTAAVLALALWSVVIIACWLLGMLAHQLEPSIDVPAFRWWDTHLLHGTWSTVWLKLTNIGAPRVTQVATVVAAVVLAALYARRPRWWAPSVIMIVGYLAEKYSQIILKLVVHRGHPPTTLGTWPSGGMGRLTVVYGLIIFFVIKRYWPNSPRMWATGWALLGFLASIQAYARLNNLEHWTTDVVGGGIYGVLLLIMMIIAFAGFGRQLEDSPTPPASASVVRETPRQPVG